MNSQPSSAIENGLTSQLMPTVAAMPRQWLLTWPSAARSILSSIGMIISQTSTATGRLICATVAVPRAWKTPGTAWPSADADDDAERHPERQIALERAHGRRLARRRRDCLAHGAARAQLAAGVDDRLAVLLGERARAAAWARISSTASDGRQSFTPSGVTTIGRLIRIGCAIIASSKCVIRQRRVAEAQLGVGRALLAQQRARA